MNENKTCIDILYKSIKKYTKVIYIYIYIFFLNVIYFFPFDDNML